jgi:hypothetical protein
MMRDQDALLMRIDLSDDRPPFGISLLSLRAKLNGERQPRRCCWSTSCRRSSICTVLFKQTASAARHRPVWPCHSCARAATAAAFCVAVRGAALRSV